MSEVVYDALVVGAGASGIFAAKELTAQGLHVVQLEAGPEVGPEHFDPNSRLRQTDINLLQRAKAILGGQSVQARTVFYDARMRHLFVDDRRNPYSTPPDAPFLWIRGRQAGGRTHTFGRVLLRWTDDDFKIQSRTGAGFDWPIVYADVAPFYEEVERNLGMYGLEDNIPTLPDSVYVHRAELTSAEAQFKHRVEERWPGRHVTSWRYIGPEPTRVLRPLREAIASGRLDIQYNAIVRRILTDTRGKRAVGAEIIDAVSREVRVVRARSVLLCASPVESIRLLMNSSSDRHPNGLGNSSGSLGRYFVDQLPCVAAGTFPGVKGWATADNAPADPFYSPSGGIYIPRDVADDGRSAASNYAFQGTIGRNPTADDSNARISFMGFGAMQPDADNRVTIDHARKDAWGIPAPRIRCKVGKQDEITLNDEVASLTRIIEGAGGQIEFTGSPLGLVEKGRGAYPDADFFSRMVFRRMFKKTMVMGMAIHEAGGARMGTDPANSILDGYNRSWDVPNLLVTDASSFPGGGVSGTTLTIMAMTIRACRHLAGELKAGSL